MMALCLKQVFNKDKTFRPRKKFEPGTQRFELYKKAQASLKSGLDLKAVVQLPPGESINDWIAVHVVDFFNRINLIYGTMSEYCTEKSCPIMSGGLKYEYRWQDDSKYKKPTKLSAPQYMCMLMDWIEMLINNEDIFPTRIERNDRTNLPLKHFGSRTQLAHSESDGTRHPVVGDLFPRTRSGHFNSVDYECCRRASSGQG
ncbi:MOB kinase activator 3C isoform X2 [Athene noctua]|uniref:MOB kinase activator 3C isoform X2 n=1 Tax=Athene noctua TaxID=126797 RepID=UPI003EBCB966